MFIGTKYQWRGLVVCPLHHPPEARKLCPDAIGKCDAGDEVEGVLEVKNIEIPVLTRLERVNVLLQQCEQRFNPTSGSNTKLNI